MLYRTLSLIILFTLVLASCGDDGGGPNAPPPPSGRGDGGTALPDAGPIAPPSISRCTAEAPIQVGESDGNAFGDPDGVDIISRPGTNNEFLLVTAQMHCPLAPAQLCNGIDSAGPETWSRRRALIYAISSSQGSVPQGPNMVNLGVVLGLVSHTSVNEPRLVNAGDNLVVAWLDTVDFQPRNVWAAAVSPSTLEPIGPQSQISEIAASEDEPSANWRAASKHHLLSGPDGVEVVFQIYGRQDSAPTLHRAAISASGERLGSVTNIGEIPFSDGPHGAIYNASGDIVFGRTQRSTASSTCSYFLGLLGEEAEAIEENSRGGPCSDFALTDGGTVYISDNGGSIRFRPLGVAGKPIGRERKLIDAPRGVKYSRPAIAAFANGFFMTYVVAEADGERIHGMLLDVQGDVVSKEILLDEPRDKMSTPAIAIAADATAIAVAWKDRHGESGDHRTNLLRLRCE